MDWELEYINDVLDNIDPEDSLWKYENKLRPNRVVLQRLSQTKYPKILIGPILPVGAVALSCYGISLEFNE